MNSQNRKASSDAVEPYENKGLQNWELGRLQWLDYSGEPSKTIPISQQLADQPCCYPSSKKKKRGATSLNIDKIIDLIVSNKWRLGTKGDKKYKEKAMFEKPVPLPQMVDILVDLWEAEGMDG